MENIYKENACPVCNEPTKQDETQVYCENCGFSIRKKEEVLTPKSVQSCQKKVIILPI